MEAAGPATGVAGLAGLSPPCIQCYEPIRRGAASDFYYRILETKFDNQELRLSAWGQACSLADTSQYNTRLDDPVLRSRIVKTLECIRELFEDEKRLRKCFGVKPPRANLLLESFFHWKKQQRSRRFRDRARWVIHDRSKFAELVQHLEDFNDDLEALTKLIPDVEARKWRPVRMEMEEVDDVETLDEIDVASVDDGDLISDVVSLRLESMGSVRPARSLRTGTTGPSTHGIKSYFTALTSIPATIEEIPEPPVAAKAEQPLVQKPKLSRYW
ncbi:hypothetical protein OQA88_2938 [Cercophora sp. LCS_1]